MDERDVDVVLERARTLWADMFGDSRKTFKFARRDKNSKRAVIQQGLPSETQWLKRRRADVRAKVATAVAEPIVVEDDNAWTELHVKEAKLQSARQLGKKLNALERGNLLPDEIDDELIAGQRHALR